MTQDFGLYDSADVWNQPMQLGQRNLLQALIDFWPLDVRTALDVGCGDGKLTRALSLSKSVAMVGFDNSAEALSRLQLPTVQGDMASMPFADSSFDLVLSTDTLEHIPDPSHESAWLEIFRVSARHVMVAVPFREELLDATARCQQCGKPYHVNWHQRSYDFDDLYRRAPEGWRVQAFVVSGEAWSDCLPMETRYRRTAMGQWAGWAMAICPHCGAAGLDPREHGPLPQLTAAALGGLIYAALARQRVWRSHSEVLCIYTKGPSPELLPPALATRRTGHASSIGFTWQGLHEQLVSFPQVARCVRSTDSGLVMQFPAYDKVEVIRVRRVQGSTEEVRVNMEDALGSLYTGCLLAEGQAESTIELPRTPVPGFYGVILRTDSMAAIDNIQMGESPGVTWLAPEPGQACAYHCVQGPDKPPTWVQVTGATWMDESFLWPTISQASVLTEDLLREIERYAEQFQAVEQERSRLVSRELEASQVNEQNLRAERDALLMRALEADRLAVEVQNLKAEQALLRERAVAADKWSVTVQNLRAVRDALLGRVHEADRLVVDTQNLRAERDALLDRAREADRLAVEVQNLSAERDALQKLAHESNSLAVDVQNLRAEREALLIRARDADRLAVDVQNLRAERDALLGRAREADLLAVDLQNLRAQHDALLATVHKAQQAPVGLQAQHPTEAPR